MVWSRSPLHPFTCGYPVVPVLNKCSLNICLTCRRRSCTEEGQKHEPIANRRLCWWLYLSFLSSAIQLCPNLHFSCKTKSVQLTRPAAPKAKVITGSYWMSILSTLWSTESWLSISYWVLVILSFLLWLWFVHFPGILAPQQLSWPTLETDPDQTISYIKESMI